MKRLVLLITMCGALMGCADPVTEIILEIDGTTRLTRDVKQLGLILHPSRDIPTAIPPQPAELPTTVSLVPAEALDGPIEVLITAYDETGTEEQAAALFRTNFVPNETRYARINLTTSCTVEEPCLFEASEDDLSLTAMPDSLDESEFDAGVDAEPDADIDAEPDADVDAEPDAEIDADPDTGDAGVDADDAGVDADDASMDADDADTDGGDADMDASDADIDADADMDAGDAGMDSGMDAGPMIDCSTPPSDPACDVAITDGLGGGTGTAADPFLICNWDQLRAVEAGAGSVGVHYALAADLTYPAGDDPWAPIGVPAAGALETFQGTFDGRGHALTNLRFGNTTVTDGVDSDDVFVGGLFFRIGGTFENVRFINPGGDVRDRIGIVAVTIGLAANPSRTIVRNVEVWGASLNSDRGQVGGLADAIEDTTLEDITLHDIELSTDAPHPDHDDDPWRSRVGGLAGFGQDVTVSRVLVDTITITVVDHGRAAGLFGLAEQYALDHCVVRDLSVEGADRRAAGLVGGTTAGARTAADAFINRIESSYVLRASLRFGPASGGLVGALPSPDILELADVYTEATHNSGVDTDAPAPSSFDHLSTGAAAPPTRVPVDTGTEALYVGPMSGVPNSTPFASYDDLITNEMNPATALLDSTASGEWELVAVSGGDTELRLQFEASTCAP